MKRKSNKEPACKKAGFTFTKMETWMGNMWNWVILPDLECKLQTIKLSAEEKDLTWKEIKAAMKWAGVDDLEAVLPHETFIEIMKGYRNRKQEELKQKKFQGWLKKSPKGSEVWDFWEKEKK